MNNTELAVKTALARAQRTMDIIRGLKDDATWMPFYYQLCDKVTILYHKLCLRKRKNEIIDLLSTLSKIAPTMFLEVGEFFHANHDADYALWCFNHTLEALNSDNQDVRLRALMGRLEILIDKKIKSPSKESDVVLSELHDLIRQDLSAASYEIRRGLSGRLNRAKLQIGKIAVKLLAEDMKNSRMK